MIAFTYILFSNKLDRFYFGSTELLPEQRLEMHLSKYYGKCKFTAKADDDWVLKDYIECDSISQARKIENYLKKMRNRKYIQWLMQNPDAIERVKVRFGRTQRSLPGSMPVGLE